MGDHFVSAIIVAAGSGDRMQGVDKIKTEIAGAPVIMHILRAFEKSALTDRVVLVIPAPKQLEYISLVHSENLEKVKAVISGGDSRQESVWNGLRECHESTFVAIHDGARPLITSEQIDQVIAHGFKYGGAVLGVPVKDTIKRVTEDFVEETPDRESLYICQTPQVFQLNLFLHAFQLAHKEGRVYTDDCQIFEQAGYPVYMSRGSYDNIKITTPEDVNVAELLLKRREK